MPLPAPPPPPSPTIVVRPFAPPDGPYGAGHRGLDLPAEAGAPVRSLTEGRVRFAGVVAGVPVVTVGLADGRRVTYQPVAAAVRAGEQVARGAILGTVPPAGVTGGHCALSCLHVGLRLGDAYVDPAVLLGGKRPPAVLKPR